MAPSAHTQKDRERESKEKRESVKGDVENVAPHYIVNAMTTKCCRLVAWQWAMASKNGAGGEWTGDGAKCKPTKCIARAEQRNF